MKLSAPAGFRWPAFGGQTALTARLDEILNVNLADDVLAWELQPDGSWTKVPTRVGVNTHKRLQELAVARARGHEIEPVELVG